MTNKIVLFLLVIIFCQSRSPKTCFSKISDGYKSFTSAFNQPTENQIIDQLADTLNKVP